MHQTGWVELLFMFADQSLNVNKTLILMDGDGWCVFSDLL